MAGCPSTGRLSFLFLPKEKKANRTSHRYNRLPLLPSGPGGIQQELVVPACWRKDTMLGGKKVREQKKIPINEKRSPLLQLYCCF
jgi:hypothetical protein